MIVEDEMIERIVLKKMLLKKFGEECQIFEAQNGKEAVEIFKREDIQVVILDIGLPVNRGISRRKSNRIRTEKRKIPIRFWRKNLILAAAVCL